MLKNMNKTKKSNLITYAIVIVVKNILKEMAGTAKIQRLGWSLGWMQSKDCSLKKRRTND